MTSFEPLNGYGGCGDAWLGLCTLASDLSAEGDWVFRGVAKQSYTLTPTIGRTGARRALDGRDLHYCEDGEKRLLREFRRQRAELVRGLDDADVMALGQHHGLVTRLLDWSQSLFGAAYFAVESGGANGGEPACLYGLRGVPVLEPQKNGCDPFSVPKDEVRLYWPAHATTRIVAQRGLFTVHGSPDRPLNGVVSSGGQMRCWLIPNAQLMRIKCCLDVAGVNRSSLSPETDGIAHYLSWTYKRDRLPHH